jgi:hypothetical protein
MRMVLHLLTIHYSLSGHNGISWLIELRFTTNSRSIFFSGSPKWSKIYPFTAPTLGRHEYKIRPCSTFLPHTPLLSSPTDPSLFPFLSFRSLPIPSPFPFLSCRPFPIPSPFPFFSFRPLPIPSPFPFLSFRPLPIPSTFPFLPTPPFPFLPYAPPSPISLFFTLLPYRPLTFHPFYLYSLTEHSPVLKLQYIYPAYKCPYALSCLLNRTRVYKLCLCSYRVFART